MRIWLHTTTRSAGLGPGGAVSVLAHAAMIAGAVYGTGRASRAVQEAAAERVYFLPPPDRVPGTRPVAERVHYVAPAAGERSAPTSSQGHTAAGAGGHSAGRVPAQVGTDTDNQPPRADVAARDSVYSILNVDEMATRVEGSAAPVYPAALIAQRVEGAVLARYVIDTTGHTEALSIQIVSSTHPGFAQAVRDAIPLMRFTPGMVAGQPVRQLVEQRFLFHLAAPTPSAADNTRALPPA